MEGHTHIPTFHLLLPIIKTDARRLHSADRRLQRQDKRVGAGKTIKVFSAERMMINMHLNEPLSMLLRFFVDIGEVDWSKLC